MSDNDYFLKKFYIGSKWVINEDQANLPFHWRLSGYNMGDVITIDNHHTGLGAAIFTDDQPLLCINVKSAKFLKPWVEPMTTTKFREKFYIGSKWIITGNPDGYIPNGWKNAGYKIGDVITINCHDINYAGFVGRCAVYESNQQYITPYTVPKQDTPVKKATQREIGIQKMINSYARAIREAGGDPVDFLENIENMTVYDMIDRLSQNGVRFHYDEQEMKNV